MCQDDFQEMLVKALEIEKNEDDDLKKILKEAGYLFVNKLVKAIKSIELAMDDLLQDDFEEVFSLISDLFNNSKKTPSERQIRKALKKRGFNKSFIDNISPLLTDSFNSIADEVAKELGSEFDWSLLSKQSKKEMEAWLKNLPKLMQLTTDDAVVKAIKEMIDGGAGIRDLERILSKMPEFSRYRARVTAITEGLSQYQSATYEAMMQSDAVYGFEWLHTPGYKEPRVAHQELHGTVIKKGEYFNVNGYLARYPLDPSLPAKERIQCHCRMEPTINPDYLKGGDKNV